MKNTTRILLLTFTVLGSAVCEEKCVKRRDNFYGRRLFDQDFGLALTPDDYLTSMISPFMFRDYYRPWRHLSGLSKDVGSTIRTEKDKFQINLDVQHFSPEEISVKTVDGYVVIEAKHEEKQDDHGFVSRQFVRRYSLPEGTQPEDVVSELSSDGVLTVSAPRKAMIKPGERIVPISQTGPVRKEVKENQDTCDSETCVSNE